MTNLLITLIYSVLALFTVGMLGSLLLHDRHRRLTVNMAFILLSVLGWQLSQIFYHATGSFSLSYWLFDLDKVFVAALTLALLLFTFRFFSLSAYTSPPMLIILGLIPCITLVLSVIPGQHELLRKGLSVLQTTPVHRVSFVARGPWYWVHAAYSYVLTMLSCLVVAVQYRKLPAQYRLSARLMILGIVGSILGNLLVITQVFPASFDFSLVGVTITSAFFFFANRKNHGLDLLMMARQGVFSSLNEAVLVVDNQGRVVRRNPHAKACLAGFGLDGQKDLDFPEIRARVMSLALRQQEDEERGGTDLFFEKEDSPFVLHMREKPMLNQAGETFGTFVTCQDVTRNRLLIEKLEGEVGLDALTGLLNEKSLFRETQVLDAKETLPLGVIVGDLSGLKPFNLKYGRQQGDAVLRVVAEVLTTTCPPDARIARVEGDEFHVLLPCCPAEQLYVLLHEIRKNLKQNAANYYQMGLALGASVRTDMKQRLKTVMLEADAHMLIDKQAWKGVER